MTHPLFILAVLGANVALSEWLVRRTALRHLGSALVVIVVTAITANAGIIPPYSDRIGVYRGVFDFVGPLAIFLLLLRVDLRGLQRVGAPMLLLFLIGSAGTMVGVFVGMRVVGSDAFGESHFALGGMFAATYIGGSINFNAVALHYGVVEDGLLYAGATLVDSAATTVWMAFSVALPRLFAGIWPVRKDPGSPSTVARAEADDGGNTELVGPADIAALLALGSFAVWFSSTVADWARAATGHAVPSILILTTLALILAQLRPVQELRGTRLSGWLAVLVFLAVIGALCDFAALRGIGALGGQLALFVTTVIGIHALFVFAAAYLLRLDPALGAIASQANIGGSTTALALARSLGRPDLALPAILAGALGNALGTYLGFLTAGWLR